MCCLGAARSHDAEAGFQERHVAFSPSVTEYIFRREISGGDNVAARLAASTAATRIETAVTKIHDGLALGTQAFDTLMKLYCCGAGAGAKGTSITSALDIVRTIRGCSKQKVNTHTHTHY